MTTEETRNVWLSIKPPVTVAKYLKLEKCRNQEEIADFIHGRFTERYIEPLRGCKTHGFSIMAVSCLMIETLESFWQGWPDTKNISKEAFKCFFKRCAAQDSPLRDSLGKFNEIATDFYTDIRCGILHQAETKGGWRIRQVGCLYNKKEKIINAAKFRDELERALEIYREKLKGSDWNDEVWCKLRNKMKQVIDNCKLPSPQA